MTKSAVIIREAIRSDMPGLWEVRYSVSENTLTPGRISDDELRRSIEDDGRGWVAEEAGRILGFAIGMHTGNVWALFVRPEAEGRGIGSALHAAMLEWFSRQPLERLWLTTGANTRARQFYASHGWQDVGLCGPDEVRFERRNYEITTDASRFDLDAIHAFLTRSYWSPGVPRFVVERAIAHSLCFGVLLGTEQVGFARMVTDRATFAYLADVYILEPHRGQGLSKRLMDAVMAHPDLQGLRRMMLATRDAHALYARYGFRPLAAPDRMMELHRPDVYVKRDGA